MKFIIKPLVQNWLIVRFKHYQRDNCEISPRQSYNYNLINDNVTMVLLIFNYVFNDNLINHAMWCQMVRVLNYKLDVLVQSSIPILKLAYTQKKPVDEN